MDGTIVLVGGRALNPRKDIIPYSLSFDWGNPRMGGCFQLALAICADALQDDQAAYEIHAKFMVEIVSRWERDSWKICRKDVLAIIADLQSQMMITSSISSPLSLSRDL